MEQERRTAIIQLAHAGHSAPAISKLLKYPPRTVRRIIKAWKDEGKSHRKPHKQRSDKKRSPRFLAGLKKSIKANPGTPMTILAKKRGVSRMTVSRAVKIDLNMTSYKLYKRQILTEKMKESRIIKGKRMLSNLKSNGGRIIFFSDEKMWTVDRKFNAQNDRWIVPEKADVPPVFTTKHPANIMTLGVIGSNGAIMPPHFFERRQKVNTEVYCEALKTIVIPWMKEAANGVPFVFQQDSAPAHKAKKTLSLLREEGVDFWGPETWPPNSPDLNPLDYFW